MNSLNLASSIKAVEFFTVNTKLPVMAVLASQDLATAKKLPPVGLDLTVTGSKEYY